MRNWIQERNSLLMSFSADIRNNQKKNNSAPPNSYLSSLFVPSFGQQFQPFLWWLLGRHLCHLNVLLPACSRACASHPIKVSNGCFRRKVDRLHVLPKSSQKKDEKLLPVLSRQLISVSLALSASNVQLLTSAYTSSIRLQSRLELTFTYFYGKRCKADKTRGPAGIFSNPLPLF